MRRGCSTDNLRAEGFFGTMTTEVFCGGGWKGTTLEELAAGIDTHIERHSTKRIKRSRA